MRVLLLFCLIFVNSVLKSQSLANYTSARTSTVAYASISSTGSGFASWRNTAAFSQDDNRSDFTDIGFDFWYNGVRYTQFSVSTNGFLDFSTSTDNGDATADDFGFDNAAFTSATIANSTNPAIAPFYDDLMAQGGTAALGNSVKYYLSGSAPTRTLTVEWINMAVYGNTTPNLNFQVQLVEGSGIIRVNYGTMNAGTFTFSYTMGMNAAVITTPTAAQLKTLQTVNSNTFNNTVQNNLTAMPTSNSRYVFTPPTPAAPTGTVTFSGVTQTAMTLNWTNWATNERGYVIYNSTDGINYTFVTQTAANATNTNVTGLLPATTYYWKVYAVTEGALSAAVSATRATNAAGNKISIASGSWGTGAIWSPAGVPTAGDNVTIANTHTVSVDVNGVCNNLTVGQGTSGVLRFSGGTARLLQINNSFTVSPSAIFNVNTTSNVTHTLTCKGNMLNNGTINFATDVNSLCDVILNKDGSQTLSGTGATNTFNGITVDLGSSINNTFEITTPSLVAKTGFLTLTDGTFKLSTTNATTITPFSVATSLSLTNSLWINSTNATVNTGAGITLYGNLTLSNGRLNIGDAADEDVLSNGGVLTVSNGTLNIAGKYYSTDINNLSRFTISGGSVNVPTSGSTSTTIDPFYIVGAGSQFNMTGGLITILREGGAGTQDLGFTNTGATGGSVTGGTLQIGGTTTPVGQTMKINSSFAVGNLVINSANANASIVTNSLSVIQNITLTTGTLTANTQTLSLGGNWANTGGTFVPGTGTVIFNSNSSQTLVKSGGETFNHLTFSGTGSKLLNNAVTTNGNLTITSSTLDVNSSGNYQVTVKGNLTNSGTFQTRQGLVLLNGTTNQTIGGTSVTNFYSLTLNNSAGATLSTSENIVNTLTAQSGTLSIGSQTLTLLSTATGSGRIAEIPTGADVIGTVTVQRFAPGGTTGWALIGAPISSALTFQDLDDDTYISCPTCPDGSAGGFTSVYTYSESVSGTYDGASSYVLMSAITDPIVSGKGYWLYLGDGQITTSPITLDVSGTIKKFNHTIPLSYTNTGSATDDGWNLIANPYPSPIRWSLLKGATLNIDNAIYAYNTDLTGGSASYVNGISSPAVGAGGIGDTIPICQGFYVHSTGATSLNATESIKVSGNPTFLKPTTSTTTSGNLPLLRLFLNGQNSYHDENVLYLQPGATDLFDLAYDAYKLRGQDIYAPFMAMQKDTVLFHINGISSTTQNYSTDVKVVTGYAGNYTISANTSDFPFGACVSLYDKFTGTTTDLKTASYSFTLSDTTTVARFVLSITQQPLQAIVTSNDPTCAHPESGSIIAVGQSGGPWNYVWKDENKEIIKTSFNKSSADTLELLSNGTYHLEMNTVGTCDNFSSDYTINATDISTANFTSVDTVYLSEGGLITFNNTSINATNFQWDFGDSLGSSSSSDPGYVYSSPGIYTIQLIATSPLNCNDTISKQVVVLESSLSSINTLDAKNKEIVLLNKGGNSYQLVFNGSQKTNIALRVYDVSGRLILSENNSYTNSLDINLNTYTKGLYYIQVLDASTSQVFKVIVN